MDNTEITEVTAVEEKKPSAKRYVMLMQHKNERRAAEILNQLPQSKLELKAIYLDCRPSGFPLTESNRKSKNELENCDVLILSFFIS